MVYRFMFNGVKLFKHNYYFKFKNYLNAFIKCVDISLNLKNRKYEASFSINDHQMYNIKPKTFKNKKTYDIPSSEYLAFQ